MKKIFSLILTFVMVVSFAACSGNSVENTNVLGTESDTLVSVSLLKQNKTDKKVGFQLDLPEKGEEIAVVKTTMGTFKIRFFPEEAPKAVYNFKKLAQQGYYDGIIFHRIMADFMVQGGDPTGTGYGGDSVWGENFEDEFNENLLNITGSLSMANAGPGTNSSQFFINYNPNIPDWEYYDYFYSAYTTQADLIDSMYGGCVMMDKLTEDVISVYNLYGGNIHLDGAFNTAGRGHTVFGQVFEGLGVIEAMSKVETNSNNKPLTEVKILSVTIEKYE